MKYNRWTKEKTFEEARKYSSRSEFSKNAKGAYVAAGKHGWLDEMSWLQPLHRSRWTKEEAIEEALKYQTIKDFINNAPGAYQASLKYGWAEEMTWLKAGNRTWTRESVIEESRKYSSRTELARACMGAYLYAKKHGMLDEMTWLPLKIHEHWTKEACFEESRKYKTRRDFSNNSSGAYTAAVDNGWLEEMTWLELLTHGEWTKEECIEEGRKYSSRSEFQYNSKGAYLAARSKGWLDEMTWFVTPVPGPLKQVREHLVYVYIDEENRACYVGRTNRFKRRDREHRRPSSKQKPDSLKKYFDAIGKDVPQPIILKNDLLPDESQYWEDYYLNEYREKGFRIINRGKTGVNVGSLGGGFIKWDKETTLEESKKYRTYGEFLQGSPSAYQAAKRYKWFDSITWLVYEQMPNGYWTKERVIEESKKYSSRHEMEEGCPAAYSAALKNGWSADLPLKYKRVGKDYYTDDKIRELAKECRNRSEFRDKYSRACVLARQRSMMDELFPIIDVDSLYYGTLFDDM